MLFLIKSSSATRCLLFVALALFCLSGAFSAKLSKKVEKPTQNNAEDKAAEAPEAVEPIEQAADDEDDDDYDEDDEESAEKADKDTNKDETEKETATAAPSNNDDKNAVRPAAATDLSVWGMVRSLWSWLRSDLSESLFGGNDDDDEDKPTTAVEGRTFGKIRRLQMALIPIIFKFGVLSAMVAFLVAIGMKSLFLLKVLVLMNAIAILGKFLTLKSSLFGQFEHAAPSFNYPGWNPHAKESWVSGPAVSGPGQLHPPSKEIHLHIHGNANAQLGGQQGAYNYESQGWASRSDPFAGYAPTGTQLADANQSDVPNITDPMALLPTKYPRRLIR